MDTDAVVAAMRSPAGASAAIIRAVADGVLFHGSEGTGGLRAFDKIMKRPG
jgi:hypothetical protein